MLWKIFLHVITHEHLNLDAAAFKMLPHHPVYTLISLKYCTIGHIFLSTTKNAGNVANFYPEAEKHQLHNSWIYKKFLYLFLLAVYIFEMYMYIFSQSFFQFAHR